MEDPYSVYLGLVSTNKPCEAIRNCNTLDPCDWAERRIKVFQAGQTRELETVQMSKPGSNSPVSKYEELFSVSFIVGNESVRVGNFLCPR